ncbi:MAG TPA: DNA-3-methyladenine glycosylase [Pirellulales bacterium]|nr:DNA-3-methyladenine glycosylase [Pirellulales bacterium]
MSQPGDPRRDRRLESDFFARDTVTVARELIGTTMIVGRCRCQIVETEAYTTDAASHSVTRRHKAAIMRETYAHIYVYKIYGVHYCLNFTTESGGVGAVLIRAAEPLAGIAKMAERRGTSDVQKLLKGPGCVCQALGVEATWNGRPLGREIKIMAPDGTPAIVAGPRIGITAATDLQWRFCLRDSPFVSRPMRKVLA